MQPFVQLFQAFELGKAVPDAMPRILYVLLDLPFLPTRSRVAELGIEQVVAHHRFETDVHITQLA